MKRRDFLKIAIFLRKAALGNIYAKPVFGAQFFIISVS